MNNNQEIKIFQAQIKQVELKTTIYGKTYQTLTLSNKKATWKINNFAKYNIKFKEILNQDYWFVVRNSVLVYFSYSQEGLNAFK